ncbi:MAG: AAA domain-containing protein [Clostridiaceae bacterium]|nr:AAA domain-containing protein [Clostridiaceae bacterium]
MKLTDFRTNDAFTLTNLRCRLSQKQVLLSDSGRIQVLGENRYRLISKEETYDFSLPDAQDSRMLTDKMKQYPYNLVQASSLGNSNADFFLHVVFFYAAQREIKLNIILNQNVKEEIEKGHFIRKSRTFEEEVRDNFLLSDGTSACYAYTAGKYRNIHGTEDGDPDTDVNDVPDEGFLEEYGNLRIYGRDYSLRIEVKGSEENPCLYAVSLKRLSRNVPPMALRIGELTFRDEETVISERIKNELKVTSGYLDIWDNYTSIEGDFLLNRARLAGLIELNRDKINVGNGGLIVYPKDLREEQRQMIAEGDYLLFTEEIPAYIADKDMSWTEYKSTLDISGGGKIAKRAYVSRKILKVDRSGYWVIEPGEDGRLPDGYITCSIEGNMRQIIRREAAREMIENGEAAFPALGMLIEGKKPDVLIASGKQGRIEPITSFVKEKIFAHEPRQKQKDAISIALNTPDIAIIQGPPGTGKTTVITAIIERLNEIADKRQDNRGQVLITSFQHDAVRNVIERLSINSLPTIKYGKQGETDATAEKTVENWCRQYAAKLKERNPQIRQTVEQKEFENRYNAYLSSPDDTNALAFLNMAKQLCTDQSLLADIDAVMDEKKLEEQADSRKLVDKIRRIRITRPGFQDDGACTADELLAELEKIMHRETAENKKIFSVLEEAADLWGRESEVTDQLLQDLGQVRMDLLRKCTPRPGYRIEKPRDDIQNIYLNLRRGLHRSGNDVDEILYELLNELENNASEVEETVAGYNYVYAATAQQSEGTDIRRAKNVAKNEHPVYDTVIIDEAARVNPGDLMIPMSQAKRRIILVGDHRQLPHIYDEEIFESMRDNGNEVGRDVVRISMFQYLKEKAEELYKADGILRTITLDAQYRMHPILGDFVNKNFYEPHGEGFESPLPAEYFRQNLSEKPYRWIHMPNSCGPEEKRGTSRQRFCEAEQIVKMLEKYICSEEGKDLSYGVITFYSAQAGLIRELLRRKNLSEKVRVGSVDAFQGMEFDVIFLSTVRNYAGAPKYDESLLSLEESVTDKESESYREWYAYKEKLGMRYYGFLTSENRLCVALSRQKKLLIVVGNAELFAGGKWGTLAETCVPALKHFYEMCMEGGDGGECLVLR